MFLRYNIKNIKSEKRLLPSYESNVELLEDGGCSVKITTDSPHKMKINDNIVFKRDIETVKDYTEALYKLHQKKIILELKNDLSIDDSIKMINLENNEDVFYFVIKKIEHLDKNGVYKHFGEFINATDSPIKFNDYGFYNAASGEKVNVDNWCLKFNFDILKVLEEQTIQEDGVEKTYPSGYYYLSNNEVVRVTDNLPLILRTYELYSDNLIIRANDFNEKSFTFFYNKYKSYHIREIVDLSTSNLIILDEELPINSKKDNFIGVRKKTYCYVFEMDADSDDNTEEVDFNPQGHTDYLGYDNVKFWGKIYTWKATVAEIKCTVLDRKLLKCYYSDGKFFNNDIIEIEDNFLIDVDNTLKNGIHFYESLESINISLPIASNNNTNLNDDDIIKNYFDERKKELVPDIIDYEKRCFTPYGYSTNNNYIPVDKIRFNLYFRDRTGSENWSTNDGMGWFQKKINDNGEFETVKNYTSGDLLGMLNFTDDDVYFQKKKLSKTFIRLSFYNSTDPLTQMLLFYSTVFLDTGDLYSKYVRNVEKKINGSIVSLVNDNTLKDDNLTVSFTVYDRYNKEKSSEGYYLYLFPDGLGDDGKIIYMKVEFNHAGYGRTIPLIQPRQNGKSMHFSDRNFPTSLLDEDNGDLKKFYDYLYIPVLVKYDSKINDYIYSFIVKDAYNKEDNAIVLNLFEPKINALN